MQPQAFGAFSTPSMTTGFVILDENNVPYVRPCTSTRLIGSNPPKFYTIHVGLINIWKGAALFQLLDKMAISPLYCGYRSVFALVFFLFFYFLQK